jgi:hypothetical protein
MHRRLSARTELEMPIRAIIAIMAATRSGISSSSICLQHSGDPAGALQQAYRMLQASVQTNSYVMAYSECFLALGIILLIGSASIWLCKKTKATGAAVGH